MRWSSVLGLLQALTACAQYQWDLIDVAAVVCPAIPPVAGAPPLSLAPPGTPGAAGTFSVNVSLDSLQQDQPYIFTFIRSNPGQVNITFQVTDATGSSVVPPAQVSLRNLQVPVAAAGCGCTPMLLPAMVANTYGPQYGSQCFAWDNVNCSAWWGNSSVGEWCCKPWCFASSSCPDAFPSDLVPGAYISYSACSLTPLVSPCPWTAVAQQNDQCACVNADQNISQIMPGQLATVGAGYGSTCAAWDSNTCDRDNDVWTLGSWCCQSWCYVSPSCPSASYSFARSMNGNLPWSSATCTSDPAQVANCSMTTPDISCQCLNVTMPTSQLPANATSDFGQTCKVHNSNRCQQGANLGIWCCLPWCWVSPMCPYKYNSTEWPGKYVSPYSCGIDSKGLGNCSYSKLCQCQSAAGAGGLALPRGLPSNYGSSCSSWDSSTCSSTWGTTAVWVPPFDWCCDIWCWVDPLCPLSMGTRNSLLGNLTYSSSVCADPGNLTYQLSTNSCVPLATSRRLQSTSASSSQMLSRSPSPRSSRAQQAPAPDSENEDLVEVSPGGNRHSWDRRLQGLMRRRSSSPRRRAPSSPRRRSSIISTGSPRRRSSSSPRRRSPIVSLSPRRRASGVPSPRRRTPVSTGSLATDIRRRTTALGSTSTYSTDRRRATGSTSSYTGSSVSYGYTNKAQLLRNYGAVPYQTSYGFSGYGAYPVTTRPNLALYAGAGLAAGAAVGLVAGGYYMYYMNYGSGSLSWRRRRTSTVEYCVVPSSGGSRTGSLMECWDCYARYQACLKASDCYSNAGCGLQLPTPMNRDDLAATGFVPSDWVSPLTLTVTSISGLNMTGLCPPTTPAAINASIAANESFVVRPDLFVTLTQQDMLSGLDSCDNVLGTACTSSCYGSNQVCVPNSAGKGTCICQDGYCVVGSGVSALCKASITRTSFAADIHVGAAAFLLAVLAPRLRL